MHGPIEVLDHSSRLDVRRCGYESRFVSTTLVGCRRAGRLRKILNDVFADEPRLAATHRDAPPG
jgi:hypothetical protein